MLSFDLGLRLRAGSHDFHLNAAHRVAEDGLLGIRGASGSGKTTLLRCLAGLCHPDSGSVRMGEETWYSSQQGIFLPPRRRSVGFVFQDYALFPHMTVYGNIQYATGDHGRTEELLELTRLSAIARHFPRELSGDRNSVRPWLERWAASPGCSFSTNLSPPSMRTCGSPWARKSSAYRPGRALWRYS